MRKLTTLFAFALTILACAPQSKAVPIVLNGIQYDVTTFTGTFNNNVTLLKNQPWWHNQPDSDSAANQVAFLLGDPNDVLVDFHPGFRIGPLFVYTGTGSFFTGTALGSPTGYFLQGYGDTPLTFAEATRINAPDGGATIFLLGLSVAVIALARRQIA